jgi:hypothetical protein
MTVLSRMTGLTGHAARYDATEQMIVSVKLIGLPSDWSGACRAAITALNGIFRTKRVNVVLQAEGRTGPIISVRVDPTIQGTAVHGQTHAEFNNDILTKADVRLPQKILINTPAGMRNAGRGVFQVIAAHEFVHALGQEHHNSHLMAQTMQKDVGDSPGQDKLRAGATSLPPISLSDDSIALLRSIWR